MAVDESQRRASIAQRVADAHGGRDAPGWMAAVSGSVVDGLADARSDVDLCMAFDTLPDEATLRDACRRAGGDWFWQQGAIADGGLVVAFRVDGIEVQIAYTDTKTLHADLDDLLLHHNPDTPNHKLAEGLLKAMPLAGAPRLAALQERLAAFPPALGVAMVRHGLATPTPWRAAAQLLHRDAELWCREIQVDACYRLLLVLCGLNGRYFTRFQVKRVHGLLAKLAFAPAHCADRIEALLKAPPRAAFDALHRLEAEVLDLVAARAPEVDLAEARRRHALYAPGD